MSWAVGYDEKWERDIGYGVPAICDHPDCNARIDRGLDYTCCDCWPYGGDRGCGLYFCGKHQYFTEKHNQLCARCLRGNPPYKPKPDLPEWTDHKMTCPSWEQWRSEHPNAVSEWLAQQREGEA